MKSTKSKTFKYLSIFYFLFYCNLYFAQSNTEKLSLPTENNKKITKALIIGISDYRNSPKIDYAHSDAISFYYYLISDAENHTDTNNIKLLINDDATSARIISELDWLVDNTKEGETVIFYFAGHGDIEKKTIIKNGFLLAVDAPATCYMAGGTLGANYLNDYLSTLIQQNKAKVLMIIDACKSGRLAGGKEGLKQTATALQAMSDNLSKILSSGTGELTYESPRWGNGGGGVFTHYLIKGMLGNADKNKDKKVMLSEMNIFLSEKIPEETEYLQNPVVLGLQNNVIANVNEKTIENYIIKQKLKRDSSLVSRGFENNSQRSYIASLQEKSFDVVNNILKGKINLARDTLLLDSAYNQIKTAYELTDKKNINYKNIKSQYLYLKAIKVKGNEEKLSILNECLDIEPEAAHIYNYQGHVYRKMHKTKEAEESFRKATEFSPKWSYPYNNLGILFFDNEEYNKAIKCYMKAIELMPENPNYYNGIGNVYNMLQDYDKAMENYKKALSIKPDFEFVYNNMGMIYCDKKDYEKAIECFNKALKINPGYEEAKKNLNNVKNRHELH